MLDKLFRGLYWWIVMGTIEVIFGYQAITGQGPMGLFSIGVIAINTLAIVGTIYDIADSEEEIEE